MEKAFESLVTWWELSGVDTPDIPKTARQAPKRVLADTPKNTFTANPVKAKEEAPEKPAATELLKDVDSLDALQKVLAEFDAGEISDHARQVVFARGNPKADIMVIGEAPGRDEDIQGRPFVGKSGQLLDKIFASIGLSEDRLYITNVINWRPPGNRNPKPDEIAMCLPFIHKHIELIDPELIILVGGVSFSALTGLSGIMKNRGQWTELSIAGKTIPALPIYHPAFLLRQPVLKKDTWHDMLALRVRLEAINNKPKA